MQWSTTRSGKFLHAVMLNGRAFCEVSADDGWHPDESGGKKKCTDCLRKLGRQCPTCNGTRRLGGREGCHRCHGTGERPRVRTLDSYHFDAEGKPVDHKEGRLVPWSPRRFTFRWWEWDRSVELALVEQADGTFHGRLSFPGSPGWGPDPMVASVGNVGPDSWEIHATGRSPDDVEHPYPLIIYAAATDDD